MNKLLLVFDYFKEAFHLNKQNKALYRPQIALIAIRVLIIIALGIGVYKWIGLENINNFTSMQPEEIFRFFLSQGLKVLLVILAYSIVSVLVEAGLLNMYKNAVTQGFTISGDFKEGISKYFLKLLAGELLILLCYLLASPFYIILGLLSLTVGFTVIPILAGIFLSMWKVSLVMNDKGIMGAISDSFSFAKKNFMPLAFLQIIHWAFAQGASGGSGSNFNFPQNSGNGTGESFFGQPGTEQLLEQTIQIFKIVVAVLIPVVALATVGASVIAMIFEVFFSLALFVAYKNGFKIEEPIPELTEKAEAVEDMEAIEAAEESEAPSVEESQNAETAPDDSAEPSKDGEVER